ncbi:MAG: hypothetical protein L0Y54_16785, partial [Sporichthyaceae bacterium]|nr:hypothetical protein [Sporichthyaceae bacterium]
DCIGAGKPGQHIRLDDQLPAAVTDIDIELLLTRTAAARRFAVNADTLLIVYLPPGVAFSDARVARYCDGPRALHQSTKMSGRRVPYAVIPRCGDVHQVTGSASHEILEATTNPQPARRGFAFRSQPASLGFTAAGVEPADPCGLLLQPQPWVDRDGFTVHRAWSNRAASRGANPCVPVPAEAPYLAVIPERQFVPMTRVGASITIMVTAIADRPVDQWSVAAMERAGGPGSTPHVDVSLDHDTVTPGQCAALTVTLRRADLAGPVVVLLISTLDGRSHRWPLIISTGS